MCLYTVSKMSEPECKAQVIHLLTVWFIFTLTELVWVVVGVVRLRSKLRGQFKYGHSHLPRLQMQ